MSYGLWGVVVLAAVVLAAVVLAALVSGSNRGLRRRAAADLAHELVSEARTILQGSDEADRVPVLLSLGGRYVPVGRYCREQRCAVYWCPASRAIECPAHGGFDVCCSDPDIHEFLDGADGLTIPAADQ